MTPNRIAFVTRHRFWRATLLSALSIVTDQGLNAQAVSKPPLSPIEQKIRDYVRAHEAEQIAFLEKAVNISSGTFNLAGVRAVGGGGGRSREK
jgi:glutamate carboxypeptidase